MKLTEQEFKSLVNETARECLKIIISKIDSMSDDELKNCQYLFAQRVVNSIWLWAHPQASEIIISHMKEELNDNQ